MFNSIARFGAALIATLAIAAPASASTFSIDYSDLWGGGSPQPTENGWGLNLIQQGDVIFGTMFVYGSDNTARWFSVTLTPTGGTTTWSGALDQTTGSFFGAPWSNASVTHSGVGTMTVTFNTAATGSLTYNVGATTVNKQISRFTLRGPNLAGHYLGGAVATASNCPNGVLIFDSLTVSQTGTNLAMQVDFFSATGVQSRCTFNGALTVTGRTGSISGNYNCTTGGTAANVGTFNITNLETSINGFNGNFTANDQFCSNQNGRFGGVRDVQ